MNRCLFLLIYINLLSLNIYPQSFFDGPIKLDVKLREVQGHFNSTDESLIGIGFAPDELTFKIWAKDNLNTYAWTGGNCLQDLNFNPTLQGANSIDFNTTIASFDFVSSLVPEFIDLKIDAWEDDLPSDGLLGFCNTGTACDWNDVECCGFYLFGLCVGLETGDDYRCSADPFYQGLSYRNGPPCQWYSHGYINGSGCVNPSSQSGAPNTDGYYRPHIETYWQYTKGNNFINSIDMGAINSNVVTHFNSNECYTDYYNASPGNDVIYSFTITNPTGVNISLCGVDGAQFDSYLYLVYDTNSTAIASNDNYCSVQSEISTSLCNIGTYYIVVDATNANELGTFTLSINEDPNFIFSSDISYSDVSCESGNDGSIYVSLTGNGGVPPFNYYWYDFNMNPISSNTNTMNINDSLISLDTGIYILEIFDDRNCTLVDTIILDSLESLSINITADTSILCSGDIVNIYASGAVSYSWFPVSSLNINTGSIVQADPTVSTTYSVIANGVNGCEDTASINISVLQGPVLSITPSNIEMCHGDTVSVFVSGAENYNWSPNTAISSIYEDTVVIYATNSMVFDLNATNSIGCVSSTQLPVLVHPNPSISISTSSDNICIGDISVLTAIGADNYNWEPSLYLTSNVGNTVAATPLQNTTYSVIGTDINNCTDVSAVTINVNPLPILSIVTSADTICEGNSVNIMASGAQNFVWSPAIGLNTTLGNNVIANPLNTIDYFLTGTDINGCTDVISSNIFVYPRPNILLNPPNANICEGSSVEISAFGASNYIWSPSIGLNNTNTANVIANPNSSIIYNVLGVDYNGCTNNVDFQLNVGITPNIIVTPNNLVICNGEQITLTASGATQYSWFPSISLSSDVGASVSAYPQITTTYTLIGADDIGCVDTVFTTVSVNDLPIASIISEDVTLCTGDTAVVIVDVTGNPPWNLMYTIDGVWQSNVTSNTSPVLILSDIEGTYSISSISDATGCSNIGLGNVEINFINTPNANFTVFPQPTSMLEPEIQFQNNSIFAASWSWDFGDGFINDIDFNPTHSYYEPGEYVVRLVVENDICYDTASYKINIDPVYTLYIPEVFTPNNDGLNDIFMAKGQAVADFNMFIYNRWGDQIYYTNDINKGWDGTISQNRIAPLGNYNYLIKVVDDLGVSHTVKGTVLLN